MNTHRELLPPHLEEDDKVILFDGVCKLCNAWSHFIIHHDKNHDFKLASVQSQQGKDILAYFNYPTGVYETMLVVHGDRCMEKSDAFFFVMKTMGFPWRLLLVFSIIPKRLRNWLYDRVALNRYTLFGKYNACRLPTPDHHKRYLNGNAATSED